VIKIVVGAAAPAFHHDALDGRSTFPARFTAAPVDQQAFLKATAVPVHPPVDPVESGSSTADGFAQHLADGAVQPGDLVLVQ